jgi:hypothetical protein
VGAALGEARAYHWAEISAPSGGAPIGRLRYGWRVAGPMPEAVGRLKRAARSDAPPVRAPSSGGASGGGSGAAALEAAAAAADADPAHAARLRVTLHGCEGLQSAVAGGAGGRPNAGGGALRPYVRYEPPGRPGCAYNSACGEGPDPAFGEAAEWGLARGGGADAALEGAALQVRLGAGKTD